jgi:5,10-methylenetetrahydromethanopterin reductase
MKISLGLYPNQSPTEVIAAARLADELGFDTLWVVDSHLLFREVYTLFGAIAVSTKRIRLGTAVTNPLTRHPTVTASTFATLADLSEGRVTLGISVGDSALRSMNLNIATMKTLETTVAQCRDLFEGREVAFGSEGTAKLTLPPGRDIPIYVAATGPKMLKLTGVIGDGVILMNGVATDLIDAALVHLREGESSAGRTGKTKIAVWAACHTDYRAVKYNVARAILRNIPGPIDELTKRTAEAVKKAYNYEQHARAEAEFAHLIPDELVPRFAFSGSPDEIKKQVDALQHLGVDEVILAVPFADQFKPREEVMRELAPLVLSKQSK